MHQKQDSLLDRCSCLEGADARPIDLARITEVTEIQFASDELVVVAQCRADLARESESTNESTEHTSTASAAPSQAEKESVDAGQAPHEPENEPEGATEALGVQTDEDKSHIRAGEQCATAQSSAQPTSSTEAPTQDATASLGRTTSESADKSEAEQQDSTTVSNSCEQEGSDESADLEKHKQFLQEAKLPVCDSPLEATAWKNGFVPEAKGIPSDQLELRTQGSLPPLTTDHYRRRSDASF